MSVLKMRQSVDDHAPGLEQLFSLNPSESSYPIEEIAGEVPAFLRGTYYLNGPARFTRAGLQYRHWLDGDGMVCALRFERGHVGFTNRFVRSHKFVAEETAGHPLFRTFGTAFAADQLKRGIGARVAGQRQRLSLWWEAPGVR